MGCAIVSLAGLNVARLDEVPAGTMKRVRAFGANILLSNIGGKIYATQDDCGHQRASLARGTLEGSIVTCPLHGAKFDVTTGANVGGMETRMHPEMMQKLPNDMILLFQRTSQLLADIEIRPLKTYRVEVSDGSILVNRE